MVKINVDMIYPIGSIYMSVNPTNPNIYFGGTWELWGSGKVPVGVDTSQTEFNMVEKTGGAKTHQHYESLAYVVSGGGIYIGGRNYNGNKPVNDPPVGQDYINAATVSLQHLTRSTDSYQNYLTNIESSLQPYITCYMWKRTA